MISVKMNDAKKYFQNICSVNNESTHGVYCKYARTHRMREHRCQDSTFKAILMKETSLWNLRCGKKIFAVAI